MKKATWFIFLLLLIVSCLDSPDCFQLNHNLIGIRFRVLGTGKSDTVLFTSIRLSGTDSIFKTSRITALPLPLDYTANGMQLYFVSARGKDTINLSYVVKSQFVSEDCGSRFFLSDMKVLRQTFDSLRVVSSSPDKTAGVNIEIFRCPTTDTLAIAFRQLVVNGGTKTSSATTLYLNELTTDFTGTPVYTNQSKGIVYLPVNLNTPDTTTVYTFDTKEEGIKKISLTYDTTRIVRYRGCGIQTFASRMIINSVDAGLKFDSVSFAKDDNGYAIRSVRDPFDPMIQVYRCPKFDIAGFEFRQKKKIKKMLFNSITVDFSAENYAPADSATLVYLPLNKNANSTRVDFELKSGEKRSVTISYTRTDKTYFRNACPDQTVIFSKLVSGDTAVAKIPNPTQTLPSIPVKNVEVSF